MIFIAVIMYSIGYNVPAWLWSIAIIELIIQYFNDLYREAGLK